MYNFNTALKGLFLILLTLICVNTTIAQCAISVASLTRGIESDAGGNKCNFPFTIKFTSSTSANLVTLTVPASSTIVCNGGPCNNIATSPSGSISGIITLNCVAVSKINISGTGPNGACNTDVTFSAGVALPAELIAFNANAADRYNKLSWQTASEEHVLAYQVERSVDARDFSAIGNVQAIGNSTNLETYAFFDAEPISLAYYRLKIVDVDGSFAYSDVVTVQRTKTDLEQVEIFPVPATGDEVTVLIHTKSEGIIFLDLFDRTGRVLQQERLDVRAGVNRMVIPLNSEAGNLYFLTIYNGEERISKSILKSNMD